MVRELGGHKLARWACAIGGAILVHGSVLLSSVAERAVDQIATPEPALVWLDVGIAQDTAPAIAGLAVADPSPPPPRARKLRPKLTKPSSRPSSESAAPGLATEPDADAAPLPPGPEPIRALGELASAGTSAWAGGPVAAPGAGGPGSGAAPSNRPALAPGLMAFGDPCRGFYPSVADVDHGEVRVVVRVDRDGSTRGSEVVAEAPAHQGFGPAARACVSRLRFRPARDSEGGAIPGQAVLALSFDRS
jgi:TonB family protein